MGEISDSTIRFLFLFGILIVLLAFGVVFANISPNINDPSNTCEIVDHNNGVLRFNCEHSKTSFGNALSEYKETHDVDIITITSDGNYYYQYYVVVNKK